MRSPNGMIRRELTDLYNYQICEEKRLRTKDEALAAVGTIPGIGDPAAGIPTYPSARLFEQMRESIYGYPPGVVAVLEQMPETLEFFPSGLGVFFDEDEDERPPFPYGGAMILGQDLCTLADYRKFVAGEKRPRDMPTWRNLLPLLDSAGIPRRRVFFTNVYMGLREVGPQSGRFPGRKSEWFVAACRAFLGEQLALQRPRLALCLGHEPRAFLAPLSPQLAAWRHASSFAAIDSAGASWVEAVDFGALQVPACVALTHTSYRPRNVVNRRYRGRTGDPAELAMIADAIAAIGGVD